MPPSYTISPSDVSSVDPASSLTAGVEFDYGTQRINIPSSVSVVDSQWIADHCAFVQATVLGIARGPIYQAFGKYKKGVDPGSGLDILAGVDAILLDGWLINSQKTTGAFKVIDVYKTDGSFPIVSNPLIQIQYETALRSGLILGSGSGGGGVVTGLTPDALDDIAAAVEIQLADDFDDVITAIGTGGSGGGSGASAAEIWSHPTRSLTDKSNFELSTAEEDAIVVKVWGNTTRTLTSFGTLVADIWSNATRSLTDKVDFDLSTSARTSIAAAIWNRLTSTFNTVGSVGALIVANLNAAVSSRSTFDPDTQTVTVGSINANTITATSIATDAITSGKIAADAIGASELAASAVSEIAAAVEAQLADELGNITATTDLTPVLNAIDALQDPDNASIAAILAKVEQIVISNGKVEATIGNQSVTLRSTQAIQLLRLYQLFGFQYGNPVDHGQNYRELPGEWRVNVTEPSSGIVRLTREDEESGSGGIGDDPILDWVSITSNQTLLSNQAYAVNGMSRLILTLPTNALDGEEIVIWAQGLAGWRLQQNNGQQIVIGDQETTIGLQGAVETTAQGDLLRITKFGDVWLSTQIQGNLSVF